MKGGGNMTTKYATAMDGSQQRGTGRWLTRLTICALGLTGAACNEEIPRPKPSVRSNVIVPLPPSPELVRKPFDKLHQDGTLTVEGLLREREKHVGESVTVRGVVKKLVKCPEPPPEPPPPEPDPKDRKALRDPKAPPSVPPPPPRPPRTCAPPPHFFLVDKNPVSKRELLVYGSMWSALPTMVEGSEVTLAGHFDIVSKDGVFLRQAGLLILDDLPENLPSEDEPPAP